MLLDFASLIKKYNIQIKGIIQLGAHYFQEKETFLSLGVNNFILVEPQEHAFNIMFEKAAGLNALCFNFAVSNYYGKSKMNCDTSNQGQSSSLLTPDKHLEKYPSIKFDKEEFVNVLELQSLGFDRCNYNVLVMDLQGNELNALKGADLELLNNLDCIYTEVNFIEMYKGCALINELDEFLIQFGFNRVETGKDMGGWSDAFYIRKND